MYKFEVWAYSLDPKTGDYDGDGLYTVVELPNYGAAPMILERRFSYKNGWALGGYCPFTTQEEAEANALEFYAGLEARKERAEENAA